jgi:hypothetical protein
MRECRHCYDNHDSSRPAFTAPAPLTKPPGCCIPWGAHQTRAHCQKPFLPEAKLRHIQHYSQLHVSNLSFSGKPRVSPDTPKPRKQHPIPQSPRPPFVYKTSGRNEASPAGERRERGTSRRRASHRTGGNTPFQAASKEPSRAKNRGPSPRPPTKRAERTGCLLEVSGVSNRKEVPRSRPRRKNPDRRRTSTLLLPGNAQKQNGPSNDEPFQAKRRPQAGNTSSTTAPTSTTFPSPTGCA